jgi:penicillin amidase
VHYDGLLALWVRNAHFPLLYSRGAVEKQSREKLLLVPPTTPHPAAK